MTMKKAKSKKEYGPPLLTDAERERYKDDHLARWKWKANPGACVDCMARDGKEYKLEEIPGRPHPNCKCKAVLVASGEQAATTQPPMAFPRVYSNNYDILAFCTLAGAGKFGLGMAKLHCSLRTRCLYDLPGELNEHPKEKRYTGVYIGYFYGPLASPLLGGITHFSAEFKTPPNIEQYPTPLHAMNGWGNFFIFSLAFGIGASLGYIELGETHTDVNAKIELQAGIDLDAMYMGGSGHIVSYNVIEPC